MLGGWRCVFRKHVWVEDTLPRLYVLDESWPPRYTDGLPAGKKFDCKHCGASQVR